MDLEFYTLYGHQTLESVAKRKAGDIIRKGEEISQVGNFPENGNWAPHLHFQFMLSLLDYVDDFPGVCYPSEVEVWKSLCPDPNLLFQSNGLSMNEEAEPGSLIAYRKKHLGRSMSLSYSEPLILYGGMGPG